MYNAIAHDRNVFSRLRPVVMTVRSVTTEWFNILMKRDGATHRRQIR